MARAAHNGGRLGYKVFRLSDVPIEIRLAAARACAEREAKRRDPVEALFAALQMERVAEDPETAATAMPDQCENKMRIVSQAEWDAAMSRSRW